MPGCSTAREPGQPGSRVPLSVVCGTPRAPSGRACECEALQVSINEVCCFTEAGRGSGERPASQSARSTGRLRPSEYAQCAR